MTPQVSVLVPAFNRAQLLADCASSALHQSFADLELVVVDNASTDGTWDVCERFAALDPRVLVFRNDTNIGPVRNWLRCVQEARGKYIKFLFSDDLLEPDCLASMVPLLDDPDVGLVYCAARVGSLRDTAPVSYAHGSKTRITAKEFLSRVLDGRAPVSPGAYLFRTEDVRRHLKTDFPTATPQPFADHGAGPDVMLALLTAEQYPCVAVIPRPLVYFRAHSESITVANLGARVTRGYHAALSYYLANRRLRRKWMHYLALAWLREMKARRVCLHPADWLRTHEGTGSVAETACLLTWSAIHILSLPVRLWRRAELAYKRRAIR